MSVYLVDYENTHSLTGINTLSENDRVIIFYSQNANSLTFDIHREILASKAAVEYKVAEVGGKNALDFQLSSYLGYLIRQNQDTDCNLYVVSNDKGFSYISEFWRKEKNVVVRVLSRISDADRCEPCKITEKPSDIESILKKAHPELSDAETAKIARLSNTETDLQKMNDRLNKVLKDSRKAGAVLKTVKTFIKNR